MTPNFRLDSRDELVSPPHLQFTTASSNILNAKRIPLARNLSYRSDGPRLRRPRINRRPASYFTTVNRFCERKASLRIMQYWMIISEIRNSAICTYFSPSKRSCSDAPTSFTRWYYSIALRFKYEHKNLSIIDHQSSIIGHPWPLRIAEFKRSF